MSEELYPVEVWVDSKGSVVFSRGVRFDNSRSGVIYANNPLDAFCNSIQPGFRMTVHRARSVDVWDVPPPEWKVPGPNAAD